MEAMEQEQERKRRPRRFFSDTYKAEVVEFCRSGSKSMGEVCRNLDLSETAVRRWVA